MFDIHSFRLIYFSLASERHPCLLFRGCWVIQCSFEWMPLSGSNFL